MKVAIVHDWLVTYAGAERVLREMLTLYPQADVTASRMVPYKKVDLIVEAFNATPDKRLVVIGDGPGFAKVKAAANVELAGFADQDVLRDTLQRARAFVFAAEEDFGIAPVEAQACGTPVIAFGKGGALETVRGLGLVGEKPTGLFFAGSSGTSWNGSGRRFGAALAPGLTPIYSCC